MQDNAKILIVDDEIKVINALKRLLSKKQYEVISQTNPKVALDMLENEKIDIIICDYKMPQMSGVDLLKYSKKVTPSTVRILITGHVDLDVAINAINKGNIYYYIEKPWKNEEIIKVIEKALYDKAEQDKKTFLENLLKDGHTYLDKMVGGLKAVGYTVETPNKMQEKIQKGQKRKKFPVWEDESILLIEDIELSYLMAERGDVVLRTEKGEYRSSETLSAWEEKLGNNNFFRCHRSYIINIDKIEKITPWFNGSYNIKLKSIQEAIPISRNSVKHLKEIFQF